MNKGVDFKMYFVEIDKVTLDEELKALCKIRV